MNLNNSQQKTPEQMVEAIFALDLDPIKFKLMDKKEGQGWTREQTDRHELDYRRFLALMAKFPDDVIAPTIEVDKFWHAHILDTMKYAQDCEQIFGYFLHHYPYFGLRGEEDAANLASAAVRMRELYQQEFGVQLDAHNDAGFCAKANVSFCAKADAINASFCAKTDAVNASFCAKAADKVVRKADVAADAGNVSFCAKANVSFCAKADAVNASSFCAKADAVNASFCAKAADKVVRKTDAGNVSFCAKANVGNVSFCAKAGDKFAKTCLQKSAQEAVAIA